MLGDHGLAKTIIGLNWLRINRKDFGVAYHRLMDNGGLVVGDTVEIELIGEAIEAESNSSRCMQPLRRCAPCGRASGLPALLVLFCLDLVVNRFERA